jgi:hypothetical protein
MAERFLCLRDTPRVFSDHSRVGVARLVDVNLLDTCLKSISFKVMHESMRSEMPAWFPCAVMSGPERVVSFESFQPPARLEVFVKSLSQPGVPHFTPHVIAALYLAADDQHLCPTLKVSSAKINHFASAHPRHQEKEQDSQITFGDNITGGCFSSDHIDEGAQLFVVESFRAFRLVGLWCLWASLIGLLLITCPKTGSRIAHLKNDERREIRV